MKILIGLDDSAQSKAALDHAVKTRWPEGTKFMALSVAPSVPFMPKDVEGVGWMRAFEGEMLQRAREVSVRSQGELSGAGLAAEARALPGDPAETLVRVAEDWGADLMIVGSHGRGVDDLRPGVASRVLAQAPCSVLVVKQKRSRTFRRARREHGIVASEA